MVDNWLSNGIADFVLCVNGMYRIYFLSQRKRSIRNSFLTAIAVADKLLMRSPHKSRLIVVAITFRRWMLKRSSRNPILAYGNSDRLKEMDC